MEAFIPIVFGRRFVLSLYTRSLSGCGSRISSAATSTQTEHLARTLSLRQKGPFACIIKCSRDPYYNYRSNIAPDTTFIIQTDAAPEGCNWRARVALVVQSDPSYKYICSPVADRVPDQHLLSAPEDTNLFYGPDFALCSVLIAALTHAAFYYFNGRAQLLFSQAFTSNHVRTEKKKSFLPDRKRKMKENSFFFWKISLNENLFSLGTLFQ